MDNKIDVKAIRKSLGMTRRALAIKLGVAEQTIRRWETEQGRVHLVHRRQLERLQRKLKMGRTTIVVAASDAKASELHKAGYRCDGVADNVEIQAALERLQRKVKNE